jgi:hypothetical protein
MLILKSWQKVKISRRGLVITFFVGMTAAKTESFQSCPLPFAFFPLIGGIKASTGLASVGVIFAPPCQLSSSCTQSLLLYLSHVYAVSATTNYGVLSAAPLLNLLGPNPRGVLGRDKAPRVAFVAGTGCFFDPPLKSLSCAWVPSPAISGLV